MLFLHCTYFLNIIYLNISFFKILQRIMLFLNIRCRFLQTPLCNQLFLIGTVAIYYGVKRDIRNQQNERKEAYLCTQSEKSFHHIEKRKACSSRISLMNWQRKALPFPIKPFPTGREILLNQALPYFTRCVESLVLLICMKHIFE